MLAAASEGDPVAVEIVHTQATALARQAAGLIERTGDVPPRLSLAGGLTHDAYYRNRLAKALCEKLKGWHVEPPRHSPVEGALRRACPDAAPGER